VYEDLDDSIDMKEEAPLQIITARYDRSARTLRMLKGQNANKNLLTFSWESEILCTGTIGSQRCGKRMVN
jgi:hypothetical protein